MFQESFMRDRDEKLSKALGNIDFFIKSMINRHHTALGTFKFKTTEDAEHMKLDLIMFDDEECFDDNKEGIRECQ